MSPAEPLKTRLIRPGPARSRLEAAEYASQQPCANCGRGTHRTFSRPARPDDGGVWEVQTNCHHCGSILRYLFDAGPGWIDGPADFSRGGDPDSFAIAFGPEGTVSALFGEDDYRALRDRAQRRALIAEEEIAETAAPDRGLTDRAAQAALKCLRPMIELERLGAALPDDHAALRTRLAALAEAAGVTVPPPPG